MAVADPASFRDPSGFVYEEEGRIFRQINPRFVETYRLFVRSGLGDELVESGQLIRSSVVEDHESGMLLAAERVPIVSYPYEWSFAQLKDAALLTLDLCLKALDKAHVLKDASAYNIQFIGCNPIFIDTLSFEPYVDGSPWVAYGQFCRHFLAPLAVAAYTDARILQSLSTHIDGLPLDLACAMLPWKARFSPGLAAHLYLHARAEKGHAADAEPAKASVSPTAFRALLDSLKRTIEKLQWSGSGEWSHYYEDTNYSAPAMAAKQQLVRQLIGKATPQTCFDLGANDGTMSMIAADLGAYTLAFDLDAAAVQRGYRQKHERILPLVQDMANPSAGIGWNGRERKSLFDRGPADMILALALIHHLRITAQIPLGMISETFARLGNWAMVEFVPKEDSQVQRLLRTREDLFDDYTAEGFHAAFEPHFEFIDSQSVHDSVRTLHLMKKR
jgi:ribosomal protein L11 methylase PrmA